MGIRRGKERMVKRERRIIYSRGSNSNSDPVVMSE